MVKWIFFAVSLFAAATAVTVPVRSRVELFRGSGEWRDVTVAEEIDPATTAIILCDLWDKHWCRGATARVGVLTEKINPVLRAARRKVELPDT